MELDYGGNYFHLRTRVAQCLQRKEAPLRVLPDPRERACPQLAPSRLPEMKKKWRPHRSWLARRAALRYRPGSPLCTPHRTLGYPLLSSRGHRLRLRPVGGASIQAGHCAPLPPWGSAPGELVPDDLQPHHSRRHRRHRRHHQDLKRQLKTTWARPSDCREAAPRTRSVARQTPRPPARLPEKERDREKWSGLLADQVIKSNQHQHQDVPCAVNSHARLAHQAMSLSYPRERCSERAKGGTRE